MAENTPAQKKTIRIRASREDGRTHVRILLTHPMETGLRKDSNTGNPIPANFIETVTAEHNGKLVFEAHLGGGVSENPFLSFKFKGGNEGDTIRISWNDNLGLSDSAEEKIA